MALNIHTDPQFEKYLEWLTRRSQKTKTDVIKELVVERYRWQRFGFQFGAFKGLGKQVSKKTSEKQIRSDLKKMDEDHDLD